MSYRNARKDSPLVLSYLFIHNFSSIQTVQIDILECLIDYDGGGRQGTRHDMPKGVMLCSVEKVSVVFCNTSSHFHAN